MPCRKAPYASVFTEKREKLSVDWDDDFYEIDDRVDGISIESLFFPSAEVTTTEVDIADPVNTHDYDDVMSGTTYDDLPSNPTGSKYSSGLDGGHWEHVQNFSPPYVFSPQVCRSSFLDKSDCRKTANCRAGLMNWVYVDKYNKQYPRFDVGGFRKNMRNSRILFLG